MEILNGLECCKLHSIVKDLELQKAKEEFKNLGFKMCSFEHFCDARN